MTSSPSSPDPIASTEGATLNSNEYQDRVAATIRQEATLRSYLKSLDKHQLDSVLEDVLVELRGQGATLRTYLRSLDNHQLDSVLEEVQVELRGREAEQLKKDFLTHSRSLQLKNDQLNPQEASKAP